MDWSALPEVENNITFIKTIQKPIDDFTALIGAATWTLEEGINVLATFKTEDGYGNASDRTDVFLVSWRQIKAAVDKAISTYELEERTFLDFFDDWGVDEERKAGLQGTTVFPDRFVDWARELSLPVPDDFYQKLMRAQKRHISRRKSNLVELTAKEQRELGRLRREQENFDLAIRATVRAVQYCISVGRRVTRDELLTELNRGKDTITNELFDRIVPLLPPEYRKGPGAPSKCKIGDPNEPEI